MCFIETDIDEICDFHDEQIRKAKTEHKCYECGAIISKGEQYEYVRMLCDTRFSTFKTCLACVEVRNKFCCSWYYGEVWNLIREELRYNDFNLGCIDDISLSAIAKFEEMTLDKMLDNDDN